MHQEFFRCHGFSSGTSADGRFALSGSAPHYAPDRTCDIQHLKLVLELDIRRKTLAGVCSVSLRALTDEVSTMTFDAVDFRQLKVTSPGRPTRFTYDSRKIQVAWLKPLRRGEAAELSITYRVVEPKLGLFFIGPDRQYPKKPVQVWTQGEDEYNHFWFPCHDAPQERMTTETVTTVPDTFTAISNGALLKTTHNRSRKTKTFHWKQNVPHAAYLTSLAVGELSEIRDRWGKVPVLYYCPKGREEDARRAFSKTPKMIEFFSKSLGVPYPYAKYSQVAAIDFIYGGMENISATTQTALTLHDERAHLDFSSDPLVAHELAHQWFGDLVTCKDWSHAWLNESFATYFEALFKEHDRGFDEFVYEMYENAQAYFGEDKERYRRPLVTHTYKNTNDLFDRHLYEKGSVILHMLRRQLGDTAFWRSMNVYLKRHYAQGVETVDLINAIQESTGKNMRPFFDQWVFKAGHPEYKVRTWWDPKTHKAHLRVLQTHGVNGETGLFSIPITFAFFTPKGDKRFTETVSKKEHLFSYSLPAEPTVVLFDPDHHVLKKVDFVKPEAMWILQLTRDPHVLGRLEAAQALGQFGSPTAVQALADALPKEAFWGTQSEIVRALGRTGTAHAMNVLIDALQSIEHPKVRRALYEALSNFRHSRVQSELEDHYSSEKSYFAEAEAIQGLGRMRDPALLGLLKSLLVRESWNDVLRSAALDGIAALRLPESVALLKKFSAADAYRRPGDTIQLYLQGTGFTAPDMASLSAKVDEFDMGMASFTFLSASQIRLSFEIPKNAPEGNFGVSVFGADKSILHQKKQVFMIVPTNWVAGLQVNPPVAPGQTGVLKLIGRDFSAAFVKSLKIELDEPGIHLSTLMPVDNSTLAAEIRVDPTVAPGDYLLTITSDGKPVRPHFGSIIKINPK